MSDSDSWALDENLLVYPLIPLRDIVVFPYIVVPLFVGRARSIQVLSHVAEKKKQKIFLVTQRKSNTDDVTKESLYTVGTLADVKQTLKLADGTLKILVEGEQRCILRSIDDSGDFTQAFVEPLLDVQIESQEYSLKLTALSNLLLSSFETYVNLNKKLPQSLYEAIASIKDPVRLSYAIFQNVVSSITDRQEFLEVASVDDRLVFVCRFLEKEISVLEVENKLRMQVRRQMDKVQHDYYLHEKMKAIQNELSGDDAVSPLDDLLNRIKKLRMQKKYKDGLLLEAKKLGSMPTISSDTTVLKNYLDCVVSLPWGKKSSHKNLSLEKAADVLNKGHHSMDKVKERILEYLSVFIYSGKVTGSVMCFVGPPGVGKTSLGKLIASALNREFIMISLGGVSDESELRGHRRTYVGAMPGKIIQALRRCKTSNPVILLDEIDKISSSWRGDPSAALLEILDSTQNKEFQDHYLEIPYDLSDVLFLTTANTLSFSRPLRDRMEIIKISGYTIDEKLEIAFHHLKSKVEEETYLKPDMFQISEGVMRDIVRFYTKESGVRELKRKISLLAQKTVKGLLSEGQLTPDLLNPDKLSEYLGPRCYRYGILKDSNRVGLVHGLAWTEYGGEMLSIESLSSAGKGEITQTGKLGEIMRESIQAAVAYIRSHAAEFGINPKIFDKTNIHIHVPEGAIPKDGPSAGVAMLVSVVSLLTGIPVLSHVAMTGEINLCGDILEIGGLKEKLLAAVASGIQIVLIPQENEKDLQEIPSNIKESLKIIPIEHVNQALSFALERPFDRLYGESLSFEGIENAYFKEFKGFFSNFSECRS